MECIYCNADVDAVDEDERPPEVDDDGAWAALAVQHAAGCEWIETRAHRLDKAEGR